MRRDVCGHRLYPDLGQTGRGGDDGGTGCGQYAGGYDDWQLQRKKQKNTVPNTENKKEKKGKKTSHRTRPRRLTFKEQRELEELPGKIEALEEEQSNIYKAMADPGFYQNQNSEISGSKLRLESIETELIESYQRWEHLEEISQN